MNNNSRMGIPHPTAEDMGYLTVEPMTGAALDANVALQGNVPVNPIPLSNVSESGSSLAHLPPGIMAPTYLLRYQAQLPDHAAVGLSKQINFADNLDHGFYYFGYVCMGLLAIWWSYTFWWMGRHGVTHILFQNKLYVMAK